MTYKIKHRSNTDFRIAYIVDEKPLNKKWVYLGLVVAAAICIQLGIDLIILGFGYVIVKIAKTKARPRRTIFEIELTHIENLISVKRPSRNGDITTYPLSSFKGFGLYRLPPSKKMKDRTLAELFFIFDDTVSENFLTSENSLLKAASQVTEENGSIYWHVPIQKRHHPTTLWKARKIIGTVDNWLALPSSDQRPKTPPQKVEIIRDFRDMK